MKFKFILSLILLAMPVLLFAQEEITITTYYPSPYGVYRELRAQRIAVGDNYMDNSTISWEGAFPAVPLGTSMIVEGNVGIGTYQPDTALDVAGVFSLRGLAVEPPRSRADEGRLYFNSNSDEFMISEDTGPYRSLTGHIVFGNYESVANIPIYPVTSQASSDGFFILQVRGLASDQYIRYEGYTSSDAGNLTLPANKVFEDQITNWHGGCFRCYATFMMPVRKDDWYTFRKITTYGSSSTSEQAKWLPLE